MNRVNKIHRVPTLLRDIKLSELLGHELNPLSKKVKEFIDSRLEGLIQFESDKYPNSIFYKKGDIVLFEHDLKNKWLWCSHQHYWLFFRREIGLNDFEIKELTEALVGIHLNFKELTSIYSGDLLSSIMRIS